MIAKPEPTFAQRAPQALVVTTTAATRDAAERLAETLLERRLAACIQLAPIDSRYLWEGRLVREAETLLTIKTRPDLYLALEAAILEAHDYEVPEIIATLAVEGSADYLRWIAETTGGKT